MNLSFIGCPSSGKTTIAALVFAELKRIGIPCEFIPEQARLYIAEKRYSFGLSPYTNIKLDDEDQRAIMRRQIDVMKVFLNSVGTESVLITDTSPLNSLLYMSEECLNDRKTADLIDEALAVTDTASVRSAVFYSAPTHNSFIFDANRIHSESESAEVDRKIPEIIKRVSPKLYQEMKSLSGDIDLRTMTVINEITKVRYL